MDLILLVENLYENNENHILTSDDNRQVWVNMVALLKDIKDHRRINSSLTKINEKSNSELFLSCHTKEQEDYLSYIRSELESRDLSLKENLSEQQMIEVGLGYALILILEEELNACMIESFKEQRVEHVSKIKRIQKVVNYDFFEENNFDADLQHYDEISEQLDDQSYQNSNNMYGDQENIDNREDRQSYLKSVYFGGFQENLFSEKNEQQHETLIQPDSGQKKVLRSPLNKLHLQAKAKAKDNHTEETKSIRRSIQADGEQKQSCILRKDFILHTCILLNRFADAIEKNADQYLKTFSPCLSHYFLNLISEQQQKENKVLILDTIPSQGRKKAIQKRKQSHLIERRDEFQNLPQARRQQSAIQFQNREIHPHLQKKKVGSSRDCTPCKLSTPDAMRMIELNQYESDPKKEHSDKDYAQFEQNNYLIEKQEHKEDELLQCSEVQQFNVDKYLFEKKNVKFNARHSIDHTGENIVDSPRKLRKGERKKNDKYESCIQGGNSLFEESQLLIHQLDIDKRRYQMYSVEQSQQIEELNLLYIDLKNKYETLLNENLQSQIKIDLNSKEGNLSNGKGLLEQSNHENKFLISQKSESADMYCLNNSSDMLLQTSEVNLMTDNFLNSKESFFHNDSDINRRLIHGELLAQSFIFNEHSDISQSQMIPQINEEINHLFNYVDIKDIRNKKIKSSHSSKLSTAKKDDPYTRFEIFALIISSLIIISFILLFIYY